MNNRIYLDYAAGTPVRERVKEEMGRVSFGNPSAIYKEGAEVKKILQKSREKVADLVGAKPEEVFFVSSSTEANNLAILGFAKANSESQIITTKIEHPSILRPVKYLEEEKYKAIYLDVDKEGFINPSNLSTKLSNSATKLTSLAWANSDIGTVQPIDEISELAKEKTTLHIDASHTEGLFNLKNVANIADMVTISSSKIGGPKGASALVVRSHVKIEPIIYGGGQERSLRSGTEGVALVVGFTKALELAQKEHSIEKKRLTELRNNLINNVLSKIDNSLLTGPDIKKERLANHASFAFKDIDGEELVLRLDQKGFAVGTGSACSTAKTEISEAIKHTEVSEDYQRGTLRVTLGRETTERDMELFVKTLIEVVKSIRYENL